ncbi:MAG TPA: hypothetical protein VF510_17515 [Ktedonobacterales bacterium]
MKTLLVMVINALLFVVIVALALVLVFVGLWLGLGLDNTPQNVWIGLAALAGAIVLLSFLWPRSPGSWFSNMYRSPRQMGAFGVGMYLKREPGGAPEESTSEPHKFPDGDY